MTINVKRKSQPIEAVELTRSGKFAKVVVDHTATGKVRLKVAKEGQQGILFTTKEAAELVDALLIITGKKAA